MNLDHQFQLRDLEWTPEHIRRFWDWYGMRPALQETYFSKMVGDSILDEVERYLHVSGLIVDFGAGSGYMVGHLLRRGIDTVAVDTSSESIRALERRWQGNFHYKGAYVINANKAPMDDASADVVLLIETIEHLGEEALRGVLGEIRRLLKRAGYLVVTAPNEEDLARHQVMCPDCGCVFHAMQHMRSLSSASLDDLMQKAGFEKLVCCSTLFSTHPRWMRPIQNLTYQIRRLKYPHLLYIGKRQE